MADSSNSNSQQNNGSQESTEIKEFEGKNRGVIGRKGFELSSKWAEKSNILVMNYGSNPLVGYNFMLRVEGVYDLPCKSIQFSPKENEYEYIQEGGLNDYVHMKRKPISKPFTFKVERYVGIDYIDPIPNGAELILPVILLISRKQADFGRSLRTFVFTGCTVMSKEFGTLDSEKSGLLTETTTISYNEMLCVDNPLDFNGEGWKFDGTLKGEGTQHARYYSGEKRRKDQIEKAEKEKWTQTGEKHYTNGYETYEKEKASKDTLIAAAEKTKWTEKGDKHYTLRYNDFEAKKTSKETLAEQAAEDMWRFEKKNKRGNRKQHAATAEKYGIKEPYATELAKIAKDNQWQFDGDKKEGNGVRHATGYKAFGSKERSKEKMASLAEKNHWKFNKKNKKGMGRRNGNIDPQELTKKQLAAKAKLWPETSSAKQPAMEPKEKLIQQAASRQWQFDKKSKKGNGVRYANGYNNYNNSGINEKDKATMIAKAEGEQWKFNDRSKKGNGVRYAGGYNDFNQSGINEKNKETMIAKAAGEQWKFNGRSKQGNEVRYAGGYNEFNKSGINEKNKATMIEKAAKEQWQFADRSKKGNGVRYAGGYNDFNQSGINETDKKTMIEKAAGEQWKFNDRSKKGNGVRYAGGYNKFNQSGINEKDKATMIEKAAKEQWQFADKSKKGNGVRYAGGYNEFNNSGKTEKEKADFVAAAEAHQKKLAEENAKKQKVKKADMIQSAAKEQWKFENQKKDGNGVRHANGYKDYGSKEKTKAAMISSAEQNHWKFSGNSKKGSGKQNGNINPQELTKKDLEKKAKLWPSVSSAAQIVEYLKKK